MRIRINIKIKENRMKKISAKKVAIKILKVLERKKNELLLKKALKKRDSESIHEDYDKELDYTIGG